MSKKIAAYAVALLGSCAVSATALGQSEDAALKTLYDRGESALAFTHADRPTGSRTDVRATGSLPRAAFASAPTVTPTTFAAPEWWDAHEAIRKAAEER